jgi:dUTPase
MTYTSGTTVLVAAGTTVDVGAGLTLTVRPRCTSTQRKSDYLLVGGVQYEYSVCRAHRGGRRAEPITD